MTDPILIAGAGPTGLTAAMELSRFGIPVRLIEKLPEPATTSRAIGVQARTLELLQQRGLASEMVRLGNQAHGGSVYGGGKRLFRLDFDSLDSRYNYTLLLSQAETERILREAVGRQGVTIERGVELVALAQDALSHDPSPVQAVLRHPDGKLEQTKAPWLISAEGAHSLARTTLDLQFEGKTFASHYALGDFHLTGDLADSDSHIFSSDHGFMAMFPFGGGRFRMVASDPPAPANADQPPSLEELQSIYDQRSHIPARFSDLGWSSWFRINSRMVPRLKIGRILLGGDAAHIHSPAGGQGMNTGIQDMINLSWKLALVMQGKAPLALLDTYEQDRLPVMRGVLSKTENLTEMIETENHLFRTLFNHLSPFIGGSGTAQANGAAQMSQLAIGYRDSPLSANHASLGSLHAGDRVPEASVLHRTAVGGWEATGLLWLLDPSRLTLLAAHADATGTLDAGLREAAARYGDLVTIVELAPPADRDAKDGYEAVFGRRPGVLLVRPDGYVGLTTGEQAAARQLEAYRTRWFAAGQTG